RALFALHRVFWERQRELGAACSETCFPHALQHIARFNDRLPGRIDKGIRTLDAPAHPENVDEAVVQDAVDVVGQTLNGRAALIFDTHSMRSLQAQTTEPKSREGQPTCIFFIRLPTRQRRIVTLGETPLLRTPHPRGDMTLERPRVGQTKTVVSDRGP